MEHDLEPDERTMVTISVNEHLHMLADEASLYFPNLPDTPFPLARSPFTVKAEDALETAQAELAELTNSHTTGLNYLQCQLQNSGSDPCTHTLSETVLYLLFHFQQLTFVN